jgi:hypothetical protein
VSLKEVVVPDQAWTRGGIMGISQWRNPVISGSGGETRTHNQRINSSDSPVRLVPLRTSWCGPVRQTDPPRPSNSAPYGLVRLHKWLDQRILATGRRHLHHRGKE